jgi:hypothetical protein
MPAFVITGTLSQPRTEIAKRIKALGGTVQARVGPKTDFVVAGADVMGTSKLEEAHALGLPVISEAQLWHKLTGRSASGEAEPWRNAPLRVYSHSPTKLVAAERMVKKLAQISGQDIKASFRLTGLKSKTTKPKVAAKPKPATKPKTTSSKPKKPATTPKLSTKLKPSTKPKHIGRATSKGKPRIVRSSKSKKE